MIRRGGRGDVPFLRDMVRHAFYWRWGAAEGPDVPASRYVDSWGRRGDAAAIALEHGARVGAAWFRLFSAEAPGYGFLDESIPELAIAVVPSRRGHGYGGELLDALIERAREEGYGALSLSVEPENPALNLYKRSGFRTVEDTPAACVMRADLGSEPSMGGAQ
ncbi:MAG: GNAT family N-acetyltransferase [Actinobacteria bacterium]|nr:GNAT family N-acetyltransferase [Actinomycetota bacterium]